MRKRLLNYIVSLDEQSRDESFGSICHPTWPTVMYNKFERIDAVNDDNAT